MSPGTTEDGCMDFPVPENERDRLTALDACDVIGTPPEADFDEIAEMAADICDCPAFVVHLVGPAEHRFSMTRAKAPGPRWLG
jgi:hypothetical protein